MFVDWLLRVGMWFSVFLICGAAVSGMGSALLVGYERWNPRYQLENGDTVVVTCGSQLEEDGHLLFSSGPTERSGVVRCRVDQP